MLRKSIVGMCALLLLGIATSDSRAQDTLLAALYGEGVHQFFAGHYEEAHSYFTKAIDQGSKDPRAYYFRGLTYEKLGRPDEADKDFKAGANEEASGTIELGLIGNALQRIQGRTRLKLEGYRDEARLVARAKVEALRKARYERFQENQNRVLRPPTTGVPGEIPDDLGPGAGTDPPSNPGTTTPPATDPGTSAPGTEPDIFAPKDSPDKTPPANPDIFAPPANKPDEKPKPDNPGGEVDIFAPKPKPDDKPDAGAPAGGVDIFAPKPGDEPDGGAKPPVPPKNPAVPDEPDAGAADKKGNAVGSIGSALFKTLLGDDEDGGAKDKSGAPAPDAPPAGGNKVNPFEDDEFDIKP